MPTNSLTVSSSPEKQPNTELARTVATIKRRVVLLTTAALITQCGVLVLLCSHDRISVMLYACSVLPTLCFVAVTVGYLFQKTLADPVASLIEDLRKLGQGDIDLVSRERRMTDFAGLGQEIDRLAERLFKTIAGVRSGAMAMALTAKELRKDNADLSKRTEGQSASLEETASTMEEITCTVAQNADHSTEANNLATTAYDTALKGGEAVQKVLQTMEAIHAASKQMVEVIGVIDGIAAQTNILALNASIEAARAGQLGRGFAVVATEVRTLAQRSSDASQMIRSLINQSIEQVDSGRERSEDAGQTMVSIMTSAKRVDDIMKIISCANREQSAAIESVGRVVVDLDLSTQKNSVLVEQAGITASVLERRVALLTSYVADFNLGSNEYGTPEQAQAMVKQGVQYLAERGASVLIGTVNGMDDTQFIDRDLYLQLIDANSGILVAHGTNPRLVGNNISVSKDADGRLFAKEMVNKAKLERAGWIEYRYAHPITGELQTKCCYFEMSQNLVVACGAYKQAEALPT